MCVFVRVAFVVRMSGFKGLNEVPTSAVLGNNKTNIVLYVQSNIEARSRNR